jgi:hypothetical protein
LGSEGEKMKKHLVVVLSMLFVLGFAAPSFAIHAAIPGEVTDVVAPRGTEIRLGGEIRIRGWYQDNITTAAGVPAMSGRPYESPSMAWYDQRVRLFLNVRTAPNVTGRILLETREGDHVENIVWGSANTLVTGGGTYLGAGVDLDVLEAWIAYTGTGLLGVPSGIRLGHMPLVVGEGTFFDHRRRGDSAILLWVEPAKGTDINFVAAKLFESTTVDNTNDVDLYSLKLTHRLDKDNTIGANLSLITSADVDGAPGTAAVGALAYPGFPAIAAARPTLGSLGGFYRMPLAGPVGLGPSIYADAKLNLWNLGLLARGRVADIGYRATLDFQFGEVDNMTGAIPAVDFEGWGITLGANYRIDPVTLRANFVYGSGDDNLDDRKAETFQAFVGNVIDPNLPTVVYNWRVDTAAGIGTRGTGIANTTAYNLGVTFSPIKDMTTHIDYYLLRASERFADTGFGSDKEIGSELNLRTTYTIARGLTYHINAGVLFAGDFYKTGVPGVTNEPENAVVFQHGIVFAF